MQKIRKIYSRFWENCVKYQATKQPSNQLLPTISTLKDLVDAGPNTNFNKNGMESKMENLTDNFRETNFVFQLI